MAKANSPLELMNPTKMISFSAFTPENLYGNIFEQALDTAFKKIYNGEPNTRIESNIGQITLDKNKVKTIQLPNDLDTTNIIQCTTGRPLYITSLPPASKGVRDYWNQWFNSVPGTCLFKPLGKFTNFELQFTMQTL